MSDISLAEVIAMEQYSINALKKSCEVFLEPNIEKLRRNIKIGKDYATISIANCGILSNKLIGISEKFLNYVFVGSAKKLNKKAQKFSKLIVNSDIFENDLISANLIKYDTMVIDHIDFSVKQMLEQIEEDGDLMKIVEHYDYMMKTVENLETILNQTLERLDSYNKIFEEEIETFPELKSEINNVSILEEEECKVE